MSKNLLRDPEPCPECRCTDIEHLYTDYEGWFICTRCQLAYHQFAGPYQKEEDVWRRFVDNYVPAKHLY